MVTSPPQYQEQVEKWHIIQTFLPETEQRAILNAVLTRLDDFTSQVNEIRTTNRMQPQNICEKEISLYRREMDVSYSEEGNENQYKITPTTRKIANPE